MVKHTLNLYTTWLKLKLVLLEWSIKTSSAKCKSFTLVLTKTAHIWATGNFSASMGLEYADHKHLHCGNKSTYAVWTLHVHV